jgi:ribosomal protein L14E/L6E/L27E
MHEIKLVRLRSGEDILSTYIEDTETEMVMLKDPMTIIFKRLASGQSVLMISPWLPVELIENNTATIYTDDILTVVEPKSVLIDHYFKMVNNLNKYVNDDTESLKNHLADLEDDMYDDDLDLEEEDVEEILEALKEKKNNKIH